MAGIVDLENTKLAWVSTLANYKVPKVTELALATDLSCVMSTAYNVGYEGSNSVSERRVCQGSDSSTPTTAKYVGNLVMFLDFDEDGEPTEDDPRAVFDNTYGSGYFIRRTGKPYSVAWTVGDEVEVFGFTYDKAQKRGGTDQGFLKITVPLFPTGEDEDPATLVA